MRHLPAASPASVLAAAESGAAMTARELAAQFGLHRSGRDWRGPCPACGYANAFVLTDRKAGPTGWCASCHNEDAIAQALGSPLGAATTRLKETDACGAQARLERAEKVWRGSGPVPRRGIELVSIPGVPRRPVRGAGPAPLRGG